MSTAVTQSDTRSDCFLCGKASEKVIWREDGFEGLSCECGMVYTNQTTSRQSADVTREYHSDHFYSLPARFKAAWMAKHCPRGRLLEIGCGAGFFLEASRQYGYEVFGLEPNLACAQQLHDKSLAVAHEFVEQHSLPQHSFDVVYHCDLLAHFHDPIRSLSAMCELLNSAGVLCFEIGLLGGISPSWYRLIGRIGLGQHLWLYSDRAFKLLMRKAQLEILSAQYFGLAPEVLGGKAVGILSKRLIVPSVGMFFANGKDRALRAQRSCVNFLRYRAGAMFPHIGPQTVLVVARPVLNTRRVA
jgi:SAM-dependent methyltransferase